jgi:hypothetical protein
MILQEKFISRPGTNPMVKFYAVGTVAWKAEGSILLYVDSSIHKKTASLYSETAS